MGILDSLMGGGGGGGTELKMNEWSKAIAGLPLTMLGNQYIEGFEPVATGVGNLQQIIRGYNEGKLKPYDRYPVEDRFAGTPDQFTQAADYASTGTVDPWSGGINRAMELYNRGAEFDPSRIDDYENAYTGGVVDEIYRIGSERLYEDLLPQVNSTFTGAGQFGSSRHEDFTNRAVRDTQREALGQVSNLLFESRDAAMGQYADERNRDIAAGRGFSELPGQASMADTNYINNLLRTGEIMRQEDQRPLDYEYNQWWRDENQVNDFLGQWIGGSQGTAVGAQPLAYQDQSQTSILGALGGIGAAAMGGYASTWGQ